MPGGGVASGGGDPGRRVPPLFDGREERREGVLALPDDDVIGILRHLLVAGRGMRSPCYRYAVRSRDLVTIEAFVDGVAR